MARDGWGGDPYWDDTEDGKTIDLRDARPNKGKPSPKINKVVPYKHKHIKKKKTMGEQADNFNEQHMSFPDWLEDEIEESISIMGKKRGKKKSGYRRMHETGSGRVLPIAAMDDKHIENFINLMIEKMISIKSQAKYEVGESGDLFAMELNGVQKMDKTTAINIISSIMYKLEPYFTELVIRGNNRYILNISEKLESLLERKKITGHNLLR
jgi:hypothetical protein